MVDKHFSPKFHGAKEMGNVKMAEPGFVNDVTA
jgi:hypothetical protein